MLLNDNSNAYAFTSQVNRAIFEVETGQGSTNLGYFAFKEVDYLEFEKVCTKITEMTCKTIEIKKQTDSVKKSIYATFKYVNSENKEVGIMSVICTPRRVYTFQVLGKKGNFDLESLKKHIESIKIKVY